MKKFLSIALILLCSAARAETLFLDMPSPIINDSVESTNLINKLNGAKESDEIILYINSRGGEVAEGFKIGLAMIKRAKNTTCVLKNAFSMAAVLLSSCKTIKLLDNSKVIIHAAREKDASGNIHFNTEAAIEVDKIFEEILDPLLTKEEIFRVFVLHEDLIISGDEYVAKRKSLSTLGERK